MQGYNLMAVDNKQEDESREAKLEVREEGAQVSQWKDWATASPTLCLQYMKCELPICLGHSWFYFFSPFFKKFIVILAYIGARVLNF